MDDNANSSPFLVLLDVDSIQKYIFATNKLKPVIGASYLLDDLNRTRTLDIVGRPGASVVYTGGGSTLLHFADKNLIQPVMADLVHSYEEHGISVTWIDQPYQGPESVIDLYEKKLPHKKLCKTELTNISASPYFKVCEWCGKDYAGEIVREERDDSRSENAVCLTCRSKHQNSRGSLRFLEDYSFTTNINEMESTSNMIAMVVMDGNSMGAKRNKVIRHARRKNCLEDLCKFSTMADEIIRKAFLESLYCFKKEKESRSFKSIRPLIIGGDDLCFLIDAGKAFKFAERLIKKIKKKSINYPRLFHNSITMSAGILFINKKYPFNLAHTMAESLLRSAKMNSRKEQNQEVSMIDFHILLSSSCNPIEVTRSTEYTYEDGFKTMVLTRKPYSLDDLRILVNDARRVAAGLPANKMGFLRQVLRKGYQESDLDMRKLRIRLREDARLLFDEMRDRYGWKKADDGSWRTGLQDLVELTALVGE